MGRNWEGLTLWLQWERNQDPLGHCALQGEASRSGKVSGSEVDNLGARAMALGVYLRCVD